MSDASVANWLMAGLAAVTGWMANETRKMAASTREMAKLDAEPYLSFVAIDIKNLAMQTSPTEKAKAYAIHPSVRLRNPGRVRITYDIQEFDITLRGIHCPSSNFDSRMGVLHPGEESTFFYPMIPSDVAMTPGDNGQCTLKVMFWRSLSERHILSLKVRFHLEQIGNNVQIAWFYLESPTYTPMVGSQQ